MGRNEIKSFTLLFWLVGGIWGAANLSSKHMITRAACCKSIPAVRSVGKVRNCKKTAHGDTFTSVLPSQISGSGGDIFEGGTALNLSSNGTRGANVSWNMTLKLKNTVHNGLEGKSEELWINTTPWQYAKQNGCYMFNILLKG